MNTTVVLAMEVGLVVFLLVPGHVALAEALPGTDLFLIGAVRGGIACQKGTRNAGCHLALAKRRYQTAFSRLVELEMPKLRRITRTMIGHSEDAED